MELGFFNWNLWKPCFLPWGSRKKEVNMQEAENVGEEEWASALVPAVLPSTL